MARNEEKARSMLNRWHDLKREEKHGRMDRRPSHTTMETSVERALQWRSEVVKELARMIAEIQADTLDEHRVRDLNDQINKKMRLKRAWEHRVVELGGPNYLGQHNTAFMDLGIAPDMKGGAYRYYGAAKKLPGVRDLLKSATESDHRAAAQTIEQIQRNVDVAYYGYLDDDDGVLQPLEEKAEKRALAEREERWAEEGKRLRTESAERALATGKAVDDAASIDRLSTIDEGFVSHVTLPSRDEIEKLIVERRKQELLRQYASSSLRDELDKVAQLVKK